MLKNICLAKFLLFCFFYAQTPEQIKQIKNIAKNTGMSKEELKSAAKSQGFSDENIKEAENKYKDENTSNKKSLNQIENNTQPETENLENTNQIQDEPYFEDDNKDQELDVDQKGQAPRTSLYHFGYDIFNRDPSAFQSSSVGVVEPDYLIGPGDEIIVMLWGETQFRQVLTVNREGFIFIPEVGQVFVNGLNLNLLESKLFRVLSQSYASLNPRGGKSSTFLDVSLGNLRPLRIQVLGEVGQPGAYTVSPSASLFSALYYFNGPSTSGSLRDIKLIRAGKEISSIDFYDYLFTGKKPKDQKLQLDDVIFIPKRMKTVSIEGEVNRPAIYELKSKESLLDIIEMSGGLRATAYMNRIQIDRIVPFDKRDELSMDRIVKDIDLGKLFEDNKKFPLQDGDRIQIFSILDARLNLVEIEGAITRPGSYELKEPLFLSDLINQADGLLGDAYLKTVHIKRMMPDTKQKLIKLDLEEAISGDKKNNIQLKSLDKVRVFSYSELVSNNSVTIRGHVKAPGVYPLLEDMTLFDLVFSKGGFVDEEFFKSAYLERADLIRYDENKIKQKIISFNLEILMNDKNHKSNVILMPDDIITIYPKTMFKTAYRVSVSGAVKNPGVYLLKNKMRLKDLILDAGGFSLDTYSYRIEISRVNPLDTKSDTYSTISELYVDRNFFDSISNSNNNVATKQNPNLMPYDLVFIRPDPYFAMQKIVNISGSVLYPGDYPILNNNENIKDIMDRAGGIVANSYLEASKFIRGGVEIKLSLKDVYEGKSADENYNVINGDRIVIAAYPKVVSILGEVSAPGAYPYHSKNRVNDLLRMSGGLTPSGDRNNIFISFPNGISKKYNRLISNPKVMDGSVIFVGIKPEEEPFDRTEYAKEVTTIIVNFAQAVFIMASIN